MPEPALRLIDADGVLVDEPDHRSELETLRREVADLQDQLDGAHRDIRAWRTRYAALERDKEKEARKDPAYSKIEELFDLWRSACRHPQSDFGPDRFLVAKSFYKRKGEDLCRLAILGAGFDPFVKIQKNGKTKRFDDWKLIFRDEDTFENFANRAPAEALAAYKAKMDEAAADDS